MNASAKHYTRSSFRETVVEHMLLADLLSLAWSEDRVIEISRAETDQYGYDLVLTEGNVTRHVQVKASLEGGRTARQNVNAALESKPSPCIVWVLIKDTPTGLTARGYLFFGGAPGSRMPSLGEKTGRNPRSKTARPNIRVVPRSAFKPVPDGRALLVKLFGAAR